jgi:sarcosine oxidase subunit beta
VLKETADVVIIGGGIQGISLAYHLAYMGAGNVCLVEMDTLGSGSSGRSAAIVGSAFQPEHCLPLTEASFSALLRFEEEMGFDPGYEPIGYLLLAGVDGASELEDRHRLLLQRGYESHLLDRTAISELTPGLNLDDITLGLYNDKAGSIDPHSVMMGYAHHARARGVVFAEGVRATGLQVERGRVSAVCTTAGEVSTGCVVNAAGFRARQVAAWAGLNLPITNLKRHILFTGPVPAYRSTFPFTYDADAAWYMRREGPGLLIGMGASESDEENPQVDWSYLDQVVEYSMHRAPPLAQATVINGWAGLRPVTPDDEPILGPVDHLCGFVNDCGWGGHGIMNAPAAGRALAEWIVEGACDTVDIGRFNANRFASTLPL